MGGIILSLIKNILKDKYKVTLLVFLVFYLILINSSLNFELGYDEARHASQGHFFYDYLRTLISGNFVSLPSFLSSYMEKGYNIGWLALYDPPFHAIVQAFVFLFLGASVYTARIATELFIILGVVLLYKLGLKVFQDKKLALALPVLFFLSSVVYSRSNMSLLSMPIAVMMTGWFYYFFYKEKKNINIIISKKLRLRLDINLIISALFLTGATLMKYQSMIYAVVFILVYAAYLALKNLKHGNFQDIFISSGVFEIIRKFAVCGFIFLIFGGWWIDFSLIKHNMIDRILFEGTGRGRVYSMEFFTFFFAETLKETYYIALFALIPIIGWFRKKGDSFLSRNMNIFLYVISIYVVATFLISNKQLRYMIHALPLLYIFVVAGIHDFSGFFSGVRKKVKQNLVFWVIICLLLIAPIAGAFSINRHNIENNGRISSELKDYLASKPDPKVLVYIKGAGKRSLNYYDTPDLFVFNAMRIKKEHDPGKSMQFADIKFWEGSLDVNDNYKGYAKFLNETSSKIKVHVSLFRFEPDVKLLELMGAELKDYGFKQTNLTYYEVFEK